MKSLQKGKNQNCLSTARFGKQYSVRIIWEVIQTAVHSATVTRTETKTHKPKGICWGGGGRGGLSLLFCVMNFIYTAMLPSVANITA